MALDLIKGGINGLRDLVWVERIYRLGDLVLALVQGIILVRDLALLKRFLVRILIFVKIVALMKRVVGLKIFCLELFESLTGLGSLALI